MTADEEPISELWKLIRPGSRRRRRNPKDRHFTTVRHLEVLGGDPRRVFHPGQQLGPGDLYLLVYHTSTTRRIAVRDLDFRIERMGEPGLAVNGFDPEGPAESGSRVWLNDEIAAMLDLFETGRLSAEESLRRIRRICDTFVENDSGEPDVAADWSRENNVCGVAAIGNPRRGHYFVDWTIPEESHPGDYMITWRMRCSLREPFAEHEMAFRIAEPDDLTR